MIKILLIFLGFLSLGLGALGVVLPGLPTTPFVLLAALLFVHSSEKLYGKLKNHSFFGPIIRRYMEQKGMLKREKITSVAMMWSMIIISSLLISSFVFRITIAAVGIIGTIVMGFVVKTVEPSAEEDEDEDRRNSSLSTDRESL